jgi:hypothetical protein
MYDCVQLEYEVNFAFTTDTIDSGLITPKEFTEAIFIKDGFEKSGIPTYRMPPNKPPIKSKTPYLHWFDYCF